MLGNLSVLTARELKIAFRNHFFSIIILLAVIYLAAIFFVIPEEVVLDPQVFYSDLTGEGVVKKALADFRGSITELKSEAEVYQSLKEENYAWGLVAQKGKPVPQFTFIFQGWEDPKLKKLLIANTENYLAENYLNTTTVFQIEEIGNSNFQKPAFNKFLVPIFLFSEVVMLGLFFVAALIFIEKDEGTFKAFLITPGNIWQYLLAKIVVMAVLAVSFTLLFTLPTLGLQPNYGQLIILIILCSIFTSLIGVLLASYFNNLSQFLFPAVFVLGILTIPSISYLFPSVSPIFIRFLPTYDFVFGLRQAVFNLGQEAVIFKTSLMFLFLDLILFYLAKIRFSQQKLWN